MAQGNLHRLKKRHFNKALQILNKLGEQALKGDTQAAAIYLRKILPDLKAVENKGQVDSKVEVTIRRED